MANESGLFYAGRSMNISKALITAAGRSHRHLPLQSIVDRAGFPRSVLVHLIEEALSAGIETIGIIISPGDEDLYRAAAGEYAGRLVFLAQPEPLGYAHAVHCGKEFAGGEHFLLMVSDHLYISRDRERSCARQLVELASSERCIVSAVQSTHESQLSSFGAVGGRLYESRPGLYQVERVLEKPSPTQAEQHLIVPGLRTGHYLCFFGMHVLSPEVMEILHSMLQNSPNPREVTLAAALDSLDARARYLAMELNGRRYDLDERYGLLTAELALALDGDMAPEVLARVVTLLADRN